MQSLCDDANQAVVGVGIDKDLDVEHIAQGGVGQDQDALDNYHVGRLYLYGLGLASAREVGIGGHLYGMPLLELLQVVDKQRPLDGCRFVKVAF